MEFISRRGFSASAVATFAVAGNTRNPAGEAMPGSPSGGADAAAAYNMAGDSGEISHDGAEIHQEIRFAAAPRQVYDTLTVTERFDQVVRLSAAMNSGMRKKLGPMPTMIDARPGGTFVLFGGYVTGRFLELVPDSRVVQAWRTASWDAGAWSIATFVLVAQSAGTRLVFDHRGFPDADAAELARGWHVNYWEPLAKSLM